MSILQRRFKRIKNVLNCRMSNLTVLVEDVNKPHNLSAILRTCDAAGVFEANFISKNNLVKTFNSTAQGSQKWIKLNTHENIISAVSELKNKGFKLYGTSHNNQSAEFRNFDYSKYTCFVLIRACHHKLLGKGVKFEIEYLFNLIGNKYKIKILPDNFNELYNQQDKICKWSDETIFQNKLLNNNQ